MSADCLIKEGDQVIVRRDKNLKVVPVRRNCKLWIERSKFFLDSAIGFPFGTSFEVCNQKLVKVDKSNSARDLDNEEEEDEPTRDNRFLTDTNTNQKLSSDEIRNMRKEGVHGEEIIEQLIQNSATFNQKNEFAQQKYIKKKKKKYMPVITVLKPTSRLLLEMYYNKGPNRICNLRADSLAQILTYANVRSGNKMLVVESCVGLVVGAVLERLGGSGTVIQLYSGSAPVQQAVESFDFSKQAQENLHSFPLFRVNTLVPIDKQAKEPGPTESTVSDNMDAQQSSDVTRQSSEPHDEVEASAPSKDNATGVSCETDTEKSCVQADRPNPDSTDTPMDMDRGAEELMDTADSCTDATSEILPVASEKTSSADHSSETVKDYCPWKSDKKGAKRKKTNICVLQQERAKKWQVKQDYLTKVKCMIEKCDSDGLIVVTKYNPTPIVLSLIDFVGPSRPIAVFCQYKEPLLDCYIKLRDRGGVVLLRLAETWLRGYQVLPNRTHPKIQMSGTGGYLLTGTTISTDKTPSNTPSAPTNQPS